MANQLPFIDCKSCQQARTRINKEIAFFMKRYAFIAGVICLSASFVKAQESNTPVFEVGASYSFVHVTTHDLGNYGENGGSAFAEYNINKTIGLVADLGGYDSGNRGVHSLSYMFGPRINWRMSRVVPYAQFLFGGVHEWGLTSPISPLVTSTPNGFATAAGLGIDINVSRHVTLKPIQVEYFMTQLPNFVATSNTVQNNLRYSGGLVFNFGSK
jgi:hypothetical protein